MERMCFLKQVNVQRPPGKRPEIPLGVDTVGTK